MGVRADEEHRTQDLIRLECQDIALLWRNNTGQDTVTRVRYGLCVGSADLIGLRRSDGRFVAAEVKSSTGRVRQEQARFLDAVKACGGLSGVARSVEEAREIILAR